MSSSAVVSRPTQSLV